MNFDINRMKRADQVIAVCGALLFISLFLPFFHVGTSYYSVSAAGRQSGFFAWAGLWLGFLGGGLGFFPALGAPWPAQLPVTKTIATLGVAALSALLLVLKFLIGFHHFSRSFGLFFAVVVAIVEVVFAGLAFRESGEALPTKADFQNLGGGSTTGFPPPPAQGYSPPPAPPAQGYAQPTFGSPAPDAPPAQGYAPPPSFGSPPPPDAPTPPPASWQQPPAEGH